MKKELKRCKNDFVYFIEHYCTINSKPIKLKQYQIESILNYQSLIRKL